MSADATVSVRGLCCQGTPSVSHACEATYLEGISYPRTHTTGAGIQQALTHAGSLSLPCPQNIPGHLTFAQHALCIDSAPAGRCTKEPNRTGRGRGTMHTERDRRGATAQRGEDTELRLRRVAEGPAAGAVSARGALTGV